MQRRGVMEGAALKIQNANHISQMNVPYFADIELVKRPFLS